MCGDIDFAYNQFTGERLALREFNDTHENIKIDHVGGLQGRTRLNWPIDTICVVHLFDHPDYNRPVARWTQTQLDRHTRGWLAGR
jgi:hypothetical protein